MSSFLKNLFHLFGHSIADRMSASLDELSAPSIVKSEFGRWCVPQRGQSNPEDQTNPVWTWLVKTHAWPSAAHRVAGKGKRREPGWCFERFGQSKTLLDDSSSIFIGGEHEDFYDPDFYVYNDVVVIHFDGSISIYGYPEETFPPTDFHTATKVGNGIYIVGCLGYVKDRRQRHTPVYFLDLQSMNFSKVKTVGEAPSWLFEHSAKYASETHSIVVEVGRIIRGSANDLGPNESVWELSLSSFEWKRR